MSPARSRRRPVPHRRTRADIVKAVVAASAIVGATALAIWLLRPGPAGIPATGGLMNRQPRASWLVCAAIGVAALAAWWILRRGRRVRSHAKVVLPVALAVVAAGSVGAGVAWPGGLLRHDVAPTRAPPTTTSTTGTPTSTTVRATSTTRPAPTGASGASGSTGTTGPSGATGTSTTAGR